MRIGDIVEYLKKCDDAYYNTATPLISDEGYESLVDSVRKADPTNPYLKKVGAKVRADASKSLRILPMGTLSKYHKEEEILKWLASENSEILVCPKYDGFAVELVYHDGRLIQARTRGDGFNGEDVLASILRIPNIPLYLGDNRELIVRGEVIIPKKNHEKVKELGYTAMRNAVPGIVRSNRIEALGYVDYVAYEFFDGNTKRDSQRENYNEDFIVEDYEKFSVDDIEGMQRRREILRKEEYPYEIDGVVLKVNDILDDDLLNPSHMIAWKYKSNRETTILRDIEYQLGVTGYFTPIGIFDPVEFQGAILTRASLGNITRMYNEFKGMTIGSVIEVSRRGDIIPYIESLVLIEEGNEIQFPQMCPFCGELLSMDNHEPHCVNKECPEKLRLQISQYVKTIGIKGIGDAVVRGLIDKEYIHSIKDIYTVEDSQILSIPRQGESMVLKWNNLKMKSLSPVELLTAYPFIDLGKKVWELVLTKFSYSDILNIEESQLFDANLKGLGDSKINNIVSQVKENKEELEWLGYYHHVL